MIHVRKQNSASYSIPVPLFDSDGVKLGSGVTPTITIEKDGGAAGAVSGTITATNAGGTAYLGGHATDRNTLGAFVLNISAAGAESYTIVGTIIAADPISDAVRGLAGSGTLIAGTGQYNINALGGVPGAFRAQAAQAGGSATTIVLDAGASTVDDIYNGSWVFIHTGTASGEPWKLIVDYAGNTRIATILSTHPWSAGPGATSQFVMVSAPVAAADALVGAIKTTSFTTGAIDNAVLASNAISSAKLAANTINSSNVADNTITAAKIASNAITAAKLAADAIAALDPSAAEPVPTLEGE